MDEIDKLIDESFKNLTIGNIEKTSIFDNLFTIILIIMGTLLLIDFLIIIFTVPRMHKGLRLSEKIAYIGACMSTFGFIWYIKLAIKAAFLETQKDK